MRFERSSGILLHPTSLPGPWGIGDLGPAAYQFVEFLAAAGQSLWQILPLGPTGYGDSPYQCFSASAGNPLLVSLDQLIQRGLLSYDEVVEAAGGRELGVDGVNYGEVIAFKLPLLRRGFERLRQGVAPELAAAFERFAADQARWLDDYALFMALKDAHGGEPWNTWAPELRARAPEALARARAEHAEAVALQQFLQFLFFQQWLPLKAYANERGIRIIGDAPIFVAYDSADVWANPGLFYLDAEGAPTVVAGVPPDYFSATGQRWGNPLYRWGRMAQDGYAWWVARLRAAFTQVDILRLDHFRGFAAYWEVPASEATAMRGRWVKGPGAALFARLEQELGALPIIAEDLGLITPDVEALRDQFHLPGMAVLQFAFGGDPANIYLPHNHTPNSVVYTGTHDNNTTVGWFGGLDEAGRDHVRAYLGRDGGDIAWDLIRAAMMSVANLAIIPFQDVLRLGADARMNTPGLLGQNWGWRFRAEALNEGVAGGLRFLTDLYGRLPPAPRPQDEEPDGLEYEPADQ
ncbi:MAG TPA: 4-alpha-glucanotransferase [Chloroflexaceae bacterium]|nr:4-alpha-glucanotransferase [Chloroflexaceae bacterium]